MSVRIEIVEGYPDASLVTGICRISEYPLALFERQIKHQHRILVCCAYVGDELVGYKLGYEPRLKYFESFLGGVLPDYRRQGIATRLMARQHDWCASQGDRFIITKTGASNRAMLIANLKAGFIISGTLLDRGTHHNVLLQKQLNES